MCVEIIKWQNNINIDTLLAQHRWSETLLACPYHASSSLRAWTPPRNRAHFSTKLSITMMSSLSGNPATKVRRRTAPSRWEPSTARARSSQPDRLAEIPEATSRCAYLASATFSGDTWSASMHAATAALRPSQSSKSCVLLFASLLAVALRLLSIPNYFPNTA